MDSEPVWRGGNFGLPWFRREDYQSIRAALLDPQNLPPDFDTWLKFAEKVKQTHQGAGVWTMRVDINLDALRDWTENGWIGLTNRRASMDTAGCAHYAQHVASIVGRWTK